MTTHHTRQTHLFRASTAFLVVSSPTHSASTLASYDFSNMPGLPMLGRVAGPGRNWASPTTVKAQWLWGGGDGCHRYMSWYSWGVKPVR